MTDNIYSLDYDTKVKLLEQTVAEMVKMKEELANKSKTYFQAKAEYDTMNKQYDYLKELKSGLQSAIKAEQALG
jgi:hypothetical protein